MGSKGLGVHEVTEALEPHLGAESGSDRLTGLPEGITEDDTEEIKFMGVALHRGRRRRLLERLKKVSAGQRFKR